MFVFTLILIIQLFLLVESTIFDTSITAYPLVVALEEFNGYINVLGRKVGYWYFVCGGTIVKSSWILTTSYCPFKRNYARSVHGVSEYQKWSRDDNYVAINRVIGNRNLEVKLFLVQLNSEISNKLDVNLSLSKKKWDIKVSEGFVIGWGALAKSRQRLNTLNLQGIAVMLNVTNENIIQAWAHETKDQSPADRGSGLYVWENATQWIHGVVFAYDDFFCPKCFKIARISTSRHWIYDVIDSYPNLPESTYIDKIFEI